MTLRGGVSPLEICSELSASFIQGGSHHLGGLSYGFTPDSPIDFFHTKLTFLVTSPPPSSTFSSIVQHPTSYAFHPLFGASAAWKPLGWGRTEPWMNLTAQLLRNPGHFSPLRSGPSEFHVNDSASPRTLTKPPQVPVREMDGTYTITINQQTIMWRISCGYARRYQTHNPTRNTMYTPSQQRRFGSHTLSTFKASRGARPVQGKMRKPRRCD